MIHIITSGGSELGFVKALPLVEYGFEWVLPAILGGIIGAFVKPRQLETPIA